MLFAYLLIALPDRGAPHAVEDELALAEGDSAADKSDLLGGYDVLTGGDS